MMLNTTFLANTLPPRHDVAGAYGTTAEMFKAFGSGFEERAKAGELGDPSEVVRALVEEVERPSGNRPLRRPVGSDIEQGVSAINRACDEVQGYLLSAFGL